MKSINILAISAIFFILLGAGCQDPTEAVFDSYQNGLEKKGYLECISAVEAEYNALTEQGTKIPEQSWITQKQTKLKDCETRYGN